MEITTMMNKGVLVVRIDGEMDMVGAAKFRETVDQYLDTTGMKEIVLNLQHVEFIDSSGIGAILGRYKKVKFSGGNLYVVGIQPVVERIFKLSGLFEIIKMYPTENEAFTCI